VIQKDLNAVFNAFTMMKDLNLIVDFVKYLFAERLLIERLSID